MEERTGAAEAGDEGGKREREALSEDVPRNCVVRPCVLHLPPHLRLPSSPRACPYRVCLRRLAGDEHVFSHTWISRGIPHGVGCGLRARAPFVPGNSDNAKPSVLGRAPVPLRDADSLCTGAHGRLARFGPNSRYLRNACPRGANRSLASETSWRRTKIVPHHPPIKPDTSHSLLHTPQMVLLTIAPRRAAISCCSTSSHSCTWFAGAPRTRCCIEFSFDQTSCVRRWQVCAGWSLLRVTAPLSEVVLGEPFLGASTQLRTSTRSFAVYALFWLQTLSIKIVFDYVMLIEPLVGPTRALWGLDLYWCTIQIELDHSRDTSHSQRQRLPLMP